MIKAEHLRKQFSTVLAVDDVSLEVSRGKIFGLLGPNGAGKSTTIRMLLNIISPDNGSVMFDGAPFQAALQNKIGYLPEERGLYRKNKLLDSILYFASLKGVAVSEAKQRAMQWLRRFDLEGYAGRRTEELSKGNQQKVQFIISIIHDPEYIVLDEPFSGLDPVNQILLKDILQDLKQQQKVIIFSTHQMDSAEKLCDEICLINHGKIVLEGSLRNVKQRYGKNSVHVEFIGDGSFLSSLSSVKQATVYENYAELELDGETHSRGLLSTIASNVEVRKFEFVEPSLNSIFLDVVGVPEQQQEDHKEISLPKSIVTKKDPRVTKALFSFIIVGLITIVLIIGNLKKGGDSWLNVALFAVVTVFTLFRYFKIRKDSSKKLIHPI
jgi:ABC-2 type transport system ATP-binding protein